LGNVSSLTGPVPGLFEGAVIGAQAYFSYINSQGGIYGRNLYLDAKDDQTTCSGNENQTTGLAGQVFGFVGSFSLYDNCGAAYLANHTGIPDASYGLSTDAVDLKNDFSIDPIKPGGYYTGAFLYWKSKYGAAVQQVGSVYPNIASAADQQLGIQKAAESVGWHWDYSQPEPATQTDFTSDVIQMKAKGVKIVYIVAENTQNTATIVENIQQQNWNPIIISPVAYGGGFVQIVKQGGANPAGIQGGNLYSMFGNFPQNDASTIPEVALYQTWMQRQNPNQLEDLYSMFSWAEAALFVQALKAAGPHVTRAAVMAQLQKVTSFNDNGMVAPANPAGKVPAHCYVLWQINNNDNYVRVDTPPGQFRCDGSFFYG
jgi:ABC-type branched-subunit amino acid transport system substrate-binding protein